MRGRDSYTRGVSVALDSLSIAIWPLVGGALAGLGSIAVVAFTKVGDRLLEYLIKRREETFKHRLETELEAFKHHLDTQIEQLRARLAHLGDRGVRSNELEYVATYNCVVSVVSHPDLTQMSDDEVQRYLANTELSKIQQEQVLNADSRNSMYSKIIQLRYIIGAAK
jgi:hypothetical protein